jgi:TolA-binding protein
MNFRTYWLIAALVVHTLVSTAQITQLQENSIRFYNRGLELFDKEKYGAAQKQFSLFLDECNDPLLRINTEYYIATCALELHNPDAIKLFNLIIEKYPESPKAKASSFQLGRYYFRQKEYSSALEQLQRVDAEYLTPEELSEYHFIIGYCQFRKENYDAAKSALEQTIEIKNKYYFPANYYYGYICYQSADLDKALKHFERVVSSKIYGSTVTLYISQIYYAKGQYSTLIPYADTITNKEIVNDVALILAQAYYETEAYEKAEASFERYKTAGKPLTREENYRMAFTYYRNKKYDKAYIEFQKVAEDKDTLAQYASFQLADCYLQLNKKQNARLAFERAYTLAHIESLTAEALFNLAKLSYELAFHQIAAKQLVEFINEYPNSSNNEEAKRILSELFLNTKNYKEAIPILESIKVKNNDIKTAYQKVTYYRAEELYLNNEFTEASKLFDKSAGYNFDKKLYSLSHFWQGEILYKEGKYEEAISKFNVCLNYYTNEIKETKYYPLTYYNLGYCEFKQENYATAAGHFERFRQLESFFGKQPQMYLDGCMRAADCYFKLKSYDRALASYDYAIERNANGSDYALFQKGMILGVLNKPDDKVKTLRMIANRFPRSGYIDDALFEIANTRLQQEDYPSAIREFEYILSEYPNSIYFRRARMSLGLIYYNKHEDEKALEQFKKVAEQYTKTPEGKEALNTIRAIYVARGESEVYFDYLKNIPDAGVTLSYQDSVSYESALTVYRNGNCTKAVQAFSSYIKRFPEGFFIVPAHFYKAECDYKDKQNETALSAYQFVLAQPRNEYSERSARMAATIQYLKKDYTQALSYYYLLEEYAQNKDNQMVAYLGQLRCSYRLEKYDTAFTSAHKVTSFTESTKEALIESNLILGRIYLNNYQQADSAVSHFNFVIRETKNANAAEAKYSLAYISFLKKDWKQCENHIFELNDNYSSYDYWVAKAFILLADVYMEKKDAFQAKATLQSIIDNYKGEELNKIAREKLALITAAEKAEKEARELKNKPVNEDDEN